TSAPDLVQSMEGCSPSSRISRSSPNLSSRRGSVTSVSGVFRRMSLVVVGCSAMAAPMSRASGRAAVIREACCRKARREGSGFISGSVRLGPSELTRVSRFPNNLLLARADDGLMRDLLEKSRVGRVQTARDKRIADDALAVKHFIEDAAAQVLAGHAGMVAVHPEGVLTVCLFQPAPAHVERVGLIGDGRVSRGSCVELQ